MKKTIIALVLGIMIGSAGTAFATMEGEVTAVFAQFKLMINGQEKQLETTPLVYNGTSYLPVREMANLVGYDVTYKADSRTIELNNDIKTGTGSAGGTAVKKPEGADGVTIPITIHSIESRTLINFIAEKYNLSYKDGLYLGVDDNDHTMAYLKFNGEKIMLKFIEGSLVDATPLIEKGIITQKELESVIATPSALHE